LDVISTSRSLAVLAAEMKQLLGQGIEDEDGDWARSDSDTERKDSFRSFLTTNSVPDGLVEGDGYLNLRPAPEINLQIPEKDPGWRAPEATGGASIHTCTNTTSLSQPLLAKTGDPVTPQGGALVWRDQYDSFMSISDEDIAMELTRIDWAEFSNIKCRDLVRHVSIPADQKEKYPSLKHVNRMIRHFNHVAYWVASVILEKPKPKHRARALEKFMNVAWVSKHHQHNHERLWGSMLSSKSRHCGT
jgi:hypothetical protein